MKYKGFEIKTMPIVDGPVKYTGLVARRKGFTVIAPYDMATDKMAMKETINNLQYEQT